MKKSIILAAVALIGFGTTPVSAAQKIYQVTGPILEMTPEAIVVQKGSDRWEIARGNATIPDTVTVGSKVTIEYFMTAKDVTAKKDAPAKKK